MTLKAQIIFWAQGREGKVYEKPVKKTGQQKDRCFGEKTNQKSDNLCSYFKVTSLQKRTQGKVEITHKYEL